MIFQEVTQNLSLLQFLKKILPKSNREIKRALEHGRCKVNGKIERFGTIRLQCGDRVEFDSQPIEDHLLATPIIIHENEHYYVLDKPIHLECSEKILRSYFLDGKLVHRLDKPTSGVFLLAKTNEAQKALSDLFRHKKVEKTYLTLVDGSVDQKEGEIASYLVRKGYFHGQTIWGSNRINKGLYAITGFELIEKRSDYTVLRCYPKTGRAHQIRVHMKEMGHPILGDFQYCRNFKSRFNMDRLYLHSEKISFPCPFNGKDVTFFAELPSNFKSEDPNC